MLTPQQLMELAGYIGASDIPILVMGDKYPWRADTNRKTLWLLKTNRKRPRQGDVAMETGDIMEHSLRYFAESKIGPLAKNGIFSMSRDNEEVAHPNGVMRCHLDGFFASLPFLLELKSSGQVNPFYHKERWGRGGKTISSPAQCSDVDTFTNNRPIFNPGVIPLEHFWQMQASIACVNAVLAHKHPKQQKVTGCVLAVNLPGTPEPFRHYRVIAHEPSIKILEEAACDFNDHYLLTDKAPPEPLPYDSVPDITLQARQGKVSDTTMAHVHQCWRMYRESSSQTKELKLELEKAIARAIDEGGPYTALKSESGEWMTTHTIVVTPKSPKPHERTLHRFSWETEDAET